MLVLEQKLFCLERQPASVLVGGSGRLGASALLNVKRRRSLQDFRINVIELLFCLFLFSHAGKWLKVVNSLKPCECCFGVQAGFRNGQSPVC